MIKVSFARIVLFLSLLRTKAYVKKQKFSADLLMGRKLRRKKDFSNADYIPYMKVNCSVNITF